MKWRGQVYRALNPVCAREPLSGRGAALYGGRFNAKGTPALYCSLSVLVALREANQVGSLQPTTLVAYDARFDSVFDARDPDALARRGMTPEILAASTWRDEMRTMGEARTQAFARDVAAQGHDAMLVRSFAAGASTDDLNLVIWRWGEEAARSLAPIDDENRLGRI